MDRCQRSKRDEQRKRKKQAKPSNPGADSDQTQATKASGNGNRIGRVISRRRSSGRKQQRCKNPATQTPITKPRQFLADYQTQAMEIGSDTLFLAAAPVEEKNTLENGFDFLFWIWFVHGFLGLRSGEWDDIWRERKGRIRKKIHVLAELKSSSKDLVSIKQNQVLWAWFSWRKSESFVLDFLLNCCAIGNRVQYTRFILAKMAK